MLSNINCDSFNFLIENQDVCERSKQFIYDVIAGICRSKCRIQELIRTPFKNTVELNLIYYLTKYTEQDEAYQIKTARSRLMLGRLEKKCL